MKKHASMGDVVKGVLQEMGPKGRLTEEAMAEAWEGAAGKAAASHSRPVSFRQATLLVHVDGSGWLYELTLKKKEILKKLEDDFKGKKLKDIRFRIGEVK